jgi:bile acid:Na+ symporter, BASS family
MTAAALLPIALKASIALTVFGVGLRATPSEAISLFTQPRKLFRSFVSMMVLVPVAVLLMALALDPPQPVKIALGALAVAPVPPIWPKKALKAGGSTSYVIGLLVAMSVMCIATIPLVLEVYENVLGVPLRQSPLEIATIVLTTVLIPLAAGVVAGFMGPDIAAVIAKPVLATATVLLLLALGPLLFTLLPAFASLAGDGTLLVMVIVVLASLAIGHRLGAPPEEDRPVLALATASRHPGIAIVIAQANFPEQTLVPAAIVMYLLVSAVFVMLYLRRMRRTSRSRAGADRGATIDSRPASLRTIAPHDHEGPIAGPKDAA